MVATFRDLEASVGWRNDLLPRLLAARDALDQAARSGVPVSRDIAHYRLPLARHGPGIPLTTQLIDQFTELLRLEEMELDRLRPSVRQFLDMIHSNFPLVRPR